SWISSNTTPGGNASPAVAPTPGGRRGLPCSSKIPLAPRCPPSRLRSDSPQSSPAVSVLHAPATASDSGPAPAPGTAAPDAGDGSDATERVNPGTLTCAWPIPASRACTPGRGGAAAGNSPTSRCSPGTCTSAARTCTSRATADGSAGAGDGNACTSRRNCGTSTLERGTCTACIAVTGGTTKSVSGSVTSVACKGVSGKGPGCVGNSRAGTG